MTAPTVTIFKVVSSADPETVLTVGGTEDLIKTRADTIWELKTGRHKNSPTTVAAKRYGVETIQLVPVDVASRSNWVKVRKEWRDRLLDSEKFSLIRDVTTTTVHEELHAKRHSRDLQRILQKALEARDWLDHTRLELNALIEEVERENSKD